MRFKSNAQRKAVMMKMTFKQRNDISPTLFKYNIKQFPETKYKTYSDSWFKETFKNVNVSSKIKSQAKQIVKDNKIGGLCDPGYIANTIKNSPNKESAIQRINSAYSSTIKNKKSVSKIIK